MKLSSATYFSMPTYLQCTALLCNPKTMQKVRKKPKQNLETVHLDFTCRIPTQAKTGSPSITMYHTLNTDCTILPHPIQWWHWTHHVSLQTLLPNAQSFGPRDQPPEACLPLPWWPCWLQPKCPWRCSAAPRHPLQKEATSGASLNSSMKGMIDVSVVWGSNIG